MRLLITIVVSVLLLGCLGQNSEVKSRFTTEEILSMNLDSTRNLIVDDNSITKIDLNSFLKVRQFDYTSLIRNAVFIPLETTNESLITIIESIIATDFYIYIIDKYQGGNVLIFNKNGDFIKRIRKGEGPEEILDLKSVDFDYSNQELIVYHNRFFSFFTPEGNFKLKEKLPLNASEFAVTPNGYLFYVPTGFSNEHLGVRHNDMVYITDKKFELKYTGLLDFVSKDNNFENRTYLNIHDNKVNFTKKFTDTVYQYIDDNKVKIKYALDISDKKLPDRVINQPFELFWKEAGQNDYYYFMGQYIENDTHDFFELENKFLKRSTVIFRDKASGNLQGGSSMKIDIKILPPFWYPIASQGSSFISYFSPYNVPKDSLYLSENESISEDQKRILKGLKDDDNPVLVFFELNNF